MSFLQNTLRTAALVCGLSILPAVATAAPTLVGATPITAQVLASLNPLSILGIDVRANDVYGVFDPGFLGFAALTDGGAAAPNSLVAALNFPSLTEAVSLFFDPSTAVFGAGTLTLTVTGTPVTAITDPALASLVTTFALTFQFVNVVPAGNDLLLTYAYNGTAPSDVPEPASFGIMAVVLVAGSVVTKWRRAAA